MQQQVEAERSKRAKILESEGVKQAAINEAEGEAEALLINARAKVVITYLWRNKILVFMNDVIKPFLGCCDHRC